MALTFLSRCAMKVGITKDKRKRILTRDKWLMLLLMFSFPNSSVGQAINAAPLQIMTNRSELESQPKRLQPGNTLYFKYIVYSDNIGRTRFYAPEVKLVIKNIQTAPDTVRSLLPESFTHIASYRLTRAGQRTEESFEYTLNQANSSVIYKLPDIIADSQSSDTLAFEFSYRVPPRLENIDCFTVKSGVNALLSAATNERPGSPKFQVGEASAESDVDFEAKTFFDFRLDPEKTRYEPIDSVDLRITYRNEGDIKDAITFNINLPAMLRTSDTVFVRAQPPSNAYVSTETTDRIIVVADDSVIADNRDREILIRFKFRITAASATVSSFSIAMVSECSRDSTAEKEFGVDLADLLAVTKSVFPNRVNPGDTINYTITLRRMLERQTLDSVIVVDNLDPGIAEILDVNPPLWSRDGNQTLRWLLLDFTETERQITFKAVIRADYYPAIVSNSRDACQGASLQNFVRGDPQQNEPNPPKQEIPEGVIGNNFSAATTSINPIGDVLRLGSVVITNLNGSSRVLPGDVLRFTVDFANVNTFAPSQFFTVCDTLPDRNYVSAPFDINQARAVYDPVTHVIRLDSLNFAPGEAGSLTFNVRVRDDIQICDDVPLMNKALLKLINGLDCNAANNALDTLLTITDPQTELRLALANFNTTVQRDRPTDFTINYNSGGSLIPLSNVTITAQLPQGMDFVSSDHSPSVAGRTLTWSGITILPSENKAIRVTVVPRASQPCFADTLRASTTIASSPVACTTAAPQEGFLFLPGTDDLLDLRVTANPEPNTALDATGAPTVTYNLLVTNNSAFDAEELVLSDTLPRAEKFSLLSASPGGEIDPLTGVITWRIARLAAGDSLQFSFQGNAKNRLYCAPDSLVNVTVLIATRLPQCEPEKIIRKHTISPTPPSEQPRLQITATRLEEARSDGAVEPYEPATFCVTLRADSSFSNLRFRSSLPNFSGWVATFGDSTVRLVPEANNPTALAAGETREFCFRLQGPQNISVDSALVRGVIVSDQNCGQAFEPLAFPAKGLPILLLALTLVDSSGNNLATDKEILTANTTLQHAASSRFNAENVTLYLALRVETPANVELLSAYDALDIKLPVALLTVNERERQWPVQFRYPVLTPQNQRIIATVNHTFFGFDRNGVLGEVKSAEVSAIMAIEHPCHARPRTFVPDQHHDGMSFQPNDGQTITIFDVAGNKVWQGNTRDDVWRGTKQNGEPALPGTYVWVISGEGGCKGTIVVLR